MLLGIAAANTFPELLLLPFGLLLLLLLLEPPADPKASGRTGSITLPSLSVDC
jgi:hypothetical protein